jgi:5-enolpyruvylshikimate-3-phosphate synthase
MAAATCAAGAFGAVSCTDAWSVNKSYPDFYEAYTAIGGKPTIH